MAGTENKDSRQAELQNWAISQLRSMNFRNLEAFQIESASDDASFRRYFRGEVSENSFIFVDAPPDKEDNASFVQIDKLLSSAEVAVPEILAVDFDRGYLMLSDLGVRVLLPELSSGSLVQQVRWYEVALETLGQLQTTKTDGLPTYDEAKLHSEMSLFTDWFVTQQLALPLNEEATKLFQGTAAFLVEEALAQPRVFVHRDYHARNLMPQSDTSLAVIDFQDAVLGPVTYDLVSLLKDCYWRLPRANVLALVEGYRKASGIQASEVQFLRWFDLIGFQRHLKCAGIFSRLNLRDGKPGYLADIPLVMDYLIEVAELYGELSAFGAWLKDDIQPVMQRQLS
jgi:aminoglycoside/choline kinase family phosphotransferase